eukprot:365703-Chlamydomonas_euryale.AAC.4
MTFLGIGDARDATDKPLHNPAFRMHDEQMPLGAAVHAATAIAMLRAKSGSGGGGGGQASVQAKNEL